MLGRVAIRVLTGLPSRAGGPRCSARPRPRPGSGRWSSFRRHPYRPVPVRAGGDQGGPRRRLISRHDGLHGERPRALPRLGTPDARTDEPPQLGLIESTNAGKSWHPVSLGGEADFHVLRTAGSGVVGYDSANDRLLRFDEPGGSPTELKALEGTLVDLAVDPGDERNYLASTGTGLFQSRNGGRSWSQVDRRRAGLLAFVGPGRALLVRGDGVVEQSTSGGRSWEAVGSIEGAPGAVAAHEGELFVAVQEGPILQSSDGGATWKVRVAA